MTSPDPRRSAPVNPATATPVSTASAASTASTASTVDGRYRLQLVDSGAGRVLRVDAEDGSGSCHLELGALLRGDLGRARRSAAAAGDNDFDDRVDGPVAVQGLGRPRLAVVQPSSANGLPRGPLSPLCVESAAVTAGLGASVVSETPLDGSRPMLRLLLFTDAGDLGAVIDLEAADRGDVVVAASLDAGAYRHAVAEAPQLAPAPVPPSFAELLS